MPILLYNLLSGWCACCSAGNGAVHGAVHGERGSNIFLTEYPQLKVKRGASEFERKTAELGRLVEVVTTPAPGWAVSVAACYWAHAHVGCM